MNWLVLLDMTELVTTFSGGFPCRSCDFYSSSLIFSLFVVRWWRCSQKSKQPVIIMMWCEQDANNTVGVVFKIRERERCVILEKYSPAHTAMWVFPCQGWNRTRLLHEYVITKHSHSHCWHHDVGAFVNVLASSCHARRQRIHYEDIFIKQKILRKVSLPSMVLCVFVVCLFVCLFVFSIFFRLSSVSRSPGCESVLIFSKPRALSQSNANFGLKGSCQVLASIKSVYWCDTECISMSEQTGTAHRAWGGFHSFALTTPFSHNYLL